MLSYLHRKWPLNLILSGIMLAVTSWLIQGCNSPPQVVDDPECFKAVDALWTAVNAKRTDLLEQSSAELAQLQAKSQLSKAGFDSLNGIVNRARSGEWSEASRSLKDFMLGQRRARNQG